MNRKLRDDWSAALRSKKYTQGKNCLRSQDGLTHCCLGVLGDIQGIDLGSGSAEEYPKRDAAYNLMIEQLGDTVLYEFTQMNDGQGLSFDAIADAVDALDVTD